MGISIDCGTSWDINGPDPALMLSRSLEPLLTAHSRLEPIEPSLTDKGHAHDTMWETTIRTNECSIAQNLRIFKIAGEDSKQKAILAMGALCIFIGHCTVTFISSLFGPSWLLKERVCLTRKSNILVAQRNRKDKDGVRYWAGQGQWMETVLASARLEHRHFLGFQSRLLGRNVSAAGRVLGKYTQRVPLSPLSQENSSTHPTWELPTELLVTAQCWPREQDLLCMPVAHAPAAS